MKELKYLTETLLLEVFILHTNVNKRMDCYSPILFNVWPSTIFDL